MSKRVGGVFHLPGEAAKASALGAEAQRRRAMKRMQHNDPRAKDSKVPLERAFSYVGERITDAERHRRTWDTYDMPLYQTLKALGENNAS